jgi:hypothetical protein
MRYEARFRATAVRYASVRPGFRGRAAHGQDAKKHGRDQWERVMPTFPPGFRDADLPFRDACSLSPSP